MNGDGVPLARNLKKSELGGVIFGCTSSTIEECLSKQLFGLPSNHFAYIKNIDPGLPLFLFNVTDRKLHGVFEAASKGEMNINPYAWAYDGVEKTPHPAQVQVLTKHQCQPLNELQFKPLIVDNYFMNNRFWFELDHAQTRNLKSLFCHSLASLSQHPKASISKYETRSPSKETSSQETIYDFSFEKELVSSLQISIAELSEELKDLREFKRMHSACELKLTKELEELREFKSQHACCEQTLAEAEIEINRLKERCSTSHSFKDKIDEVAVPLDPTESIYILGGFNGESCLSNFDAFYPSNNVIKPLKPFKFARSYASVTRLRDEIYLIGGGDGESWFDHVEAYNCSKCEWSVFPSLNEKKGSLAGVAVDDKIFALGGGNGNECFSQVEMFDFDVCRWIPARSMVHKRFGLAGATLNGVIYAAGGFDGKNYLRSAERFDPREHAWTRISDMNTKRGCHVVLSLNEKLYAVGGYDGDAIVRSTESYDPRVNMWVEGDHLCKPRGYATAVSLRDSIFVFGGVTSDNRVDDAIVDSVEMFREGEGWKEFTKAFRRCFMSAC